MRQISKKKQNRIATQWSEKDLFARKWQSTKDRTCIITGKYIYEPTAASFAHALCKKNYPELRYYLNNIYLVYWIEEHNKFDKLFWAYKKKIGHNKVYEQIKNWEDLTLQLRLFRLWL